VPKKKNSGRPQGPRKPKPPYRRQPPKDGRPQDVRVQRHAARPPKPSGRDAALRRPQDELVRTRFTASPTVSKNENIGGRPQGPPFELREDGEIQVGSSRCPDFGRDAALRGPQDEQVGSSRCDDRAVERIPALIYSSATPFVRLYHGNCLELLDAIYDKYGDNGRFDAIFADPPYFLSNGGISCHAGRMVKVDKGDWDVSRGAELNHEFNTEWLKRCQRVLKPNGTIWVSGTHHVIFSIGFAMQQLGYKILNDIAWEKPNPPPNLSCRYFTHSTETILWAAKNEKSKHVFNYQEMRKVTGKQMKTVWRGVGSSRCDDFGKDAALRGPQDEQVGSSRCDDFRGTPQGAAQRAVPTNEEEFPSIWTTTAPGGDEKAFGKHPTQKPVALIERCLLASTNEGDLVLDPFLGGGTTAIAALKLNRACIGIELDFSHLTLAMKRSEREIIEIVLRSFRVRIEVLVFSQNDLDLFLDSINGSRAMDDKPQVPTERIFHECKFVFLSCAQVERGAVVHMTVDMSLQEAWAKTPNGKKRETTHIVRCETEIFRVKSAD
jgi:site-specific DNA-methyltransferase (adenine-specific)